MDDAQDLIIEAQQLMRERAPEIRGLAEESRTHAAELMRGVDWLGDRSIGERLGPQKAWQGDYRFLYWRGPGTPPPGSEYDETGWEHLSEDDAQRLMNEHAASTPEQVDTPLQRALTLAEPLRRETLSLIEPLAHDKHFAFAESDVERLRDKRLKHSKDEAMRAISPGQFVVDRPDVVLGTPLHLGLGTWTLAAQRSAKAALELMDDLDDLITRLANRARIKPQASERRSEGAASDSRALPVEEPGSPALKVVAVSLCAIVCAAALAAAIDAEWLGDGAAATWVKAAAAGGLAVVPAFLACALWRASSWTTAKTVASVFVAVFGVAAVVFNVPS